jgi:uncharacterized protein (TIGR02453 family)
MKTVKILEFLNQLAANNTRDWFQDHKGDYQMAMDQFVSVTAQIIDAIGAFDAEVAAADLDPRKCIMRIYRDVRFSKDKSPYKTNFFAFINAQGKKSPQAGYFLNVEPGHSFLGAGIYMPENKVLNDIRTAIRANFSAWEKMVTAAPLTNNFADGVKPSGKLKKAPRGFDETDPAIEYLRYKGFFTQRMLADAEFVAADFVSRFTPAWQSCYDLVHFLNRAIAAGK